MQLALGAIGALFAGGGAAAGTTAAVVGTTATAAGIGSAGASILSGIATAASVLGVLAAGNQEAAAYRERQDQALFDAKQEQVDGVRRQTGLKRQLAAALGENEVAFAAAGIDLTGGIAEDARQRAERLGTSELSVDRATTDARRQMLLGSAANYSRMASSARGRSFLEAVNIGSKALIGISRYGNTPSVGA